MRFKREMEKDEKNIEEGFLVKNEDMTLLTLT